MMLSLLGSPPVELVEYPLGTKAAWSNAGIGSIWLPPASKAHKLSVFMDTELTDYFDFETANQNGNHKRVLVLKQN
jgi:hypothetical protein